MVSLISVDQIQSELKWNGEIIDTGEAKNVYGSPWKALFWLAQELPKHGLNLKKGDVVLTGAMGKAVPAKPGSYVAEFASLGSFGFNLRN